MGTAIERILTEWETIKAARKGSSFFNDSRQFTAISKLMDQLNLNNIMTIAELTKALQVIENILVKNEKGDELTLGKWLDMNRYQVLRDFQVSSKEEQSAVVLSYSSGIRRFFTTMHQLLLAHFQLAKLHVQGELPVSEVTYTSSQLKSQAFLDLETTSQEKELPDNSNSIKDFRRKGVTLYGANIIPQHEHDDKDPAIIQAIEGFSKDSIDDPSSRANKIFNFGGQFLEAIVLQEFSNTIQLTTQDKARIEPARSKGHINWSKENDGEIFATINIKIFSCSYIDEAEAGHKSLVIGSDGSSLVELDNQELEKAMKQCNLEAKGETENNVVPLCELNLKIKLVENDSKTGYVLKADKFIIKLNTPDLISTHAPEPISSILYKP